MNIRNCPTLCFSDLDTNLSKRRTTKTASEFWCCGFLPIIVSFNLIYLRITALWFLTIAGGGQIWGHKIRAWILFFFLAHLNQRSIWGIVISLCLLSFVYHYHLNWVAFLISIFSSQLLSQFISNLAEVLLERSSSLHPIFCSFGISRLLLGQFCFLIDWSFRSLLLRNHMFYGIFTW